MGTLDFKTAVFTGNGHDCDIYVNPPKDGCPGVPLGSLRRCVKGADGLREAPHLWYRRARAAFLDAGMEELHTATACFVLRDPRTRENMGMVVFHNDDACFSGRALIG